MRKAMIDFKTDDEGVTTVEYAVAGGLITIAIIAAINLLSGSVQNVVTTLSGLLP